MKTTKLICCAIACMFISFSSSAQTPMQFSGVDCNGQSVNLNADLDAGKAVILHFYMPNCGSCPPPAQKIQQMANKINAMFPGKVTGYAFPYINSTTCAYSTNWVNGSGLNTLYHPMDSGASQVAYYGGFGMPTVVLLGGSGSNKRTMFKTLNFVTADTTTMRDSILNLLNSTGLAPQPQFLNDVELFPNPANSTVNLSFNLSENKSYQLMVSNAIGDVVYSQPAQFAEGKINQTIDVNNWPEGIYLVNLNVNGYLLSRQIVVKH